MRPVAILSVVIALATSGCLFRRAPAEPRAAPSLGERAVPSAPHPPPPAVSGPFQVQPRTGIAGRVIFVHEALRYVVLSFSVGRMPVAGQRWTVFRHGQPVGEVQITAWRRDDTVVADVLSGEIRVGDTVRSP